MVSRKVIVFGGDGFIGSHFVDQLVAQGHKVTVFDRFSRGEAKNLVQQQGRIRMIRGDFSDQTAVRAALVGQDLACHFIWQSTPITSWDAPLDDMTLNLRTSLQLLSACVEKKVRKVVFLSSGGTVYGNTAGLMSEETTPHPFTPHGINKLAVENFLHHYRIKYGLAADVYRVANAYGSRQPLFGVQGVIAVWMGKILSGKTIEVYADDQGVRDYVYVKDVAQLMTHSLTDLTASDTYNVGTGRGVPLLALLELFKKSLGSTFSYSILPPRPSDTRSNTLVSDKLLHHFPGFAFKTLEEMLPLTWEQAQKAYTTKAYVPVAAQNQCPAATVRQAAKQQHTRPH